MDAATFRRLILGLGAALIALVAAVVVFGPSGDPTTLPAPVEAVFPIPGDTVVRQTAVEVDLPIGYGIELIVDGIRVPAAEIGVTEATGRFVWQPGPGSLLPRWSPGEHTIEIRWERTAGGQPDNGSFTWSFRVV